MLKRLSPAPQPSLYIWLRPAQPLGCYCARHFPPRQLVKSAPIRKAEASNTSTERTANVGDAHAPVLNEREVEGMSQFLDSLKWDDNNLVTIIVQVSALTTL